MKPILILIFANIATAGTIYNVTDLGTAGGSTAETFLLNDKGAVLFDSAGTASGINNAGEISGTQYIGGQPYATAWTGGEAQTVAGAGSYAMAIDARGDVAGMLTASGEGHAFVTQNGAVEDLGTLPGGSWGAAYAIDNSGTAAGYGEIGGAMRGFLWSPRTGYTILGTLGGANSYAMALDNSGEAAGGAQTTNGYMHAAVWSHGAIQDLGTLGGPSSFAYGLNGSGEAVGDSSLAASPETHAFLFDSGAMIDLNNLIDPDSGWTLTEAFAINSVGQILGTGTFQGDGRAFLLTPSAEPFAASLNSGPAPVPEPPAWPLMLLGLASGLFARRFGFVRSCRPRF
ncbi:MAG TPA: hypothetical protein VFW83_00145 [Bryobacteraceae bacterium]|nr:hypothetical protein [Bryobacteraceae bacterium]